MTLLVVDASTIVAVLTDGGPAGVAAAGAVDGHDVAAPELLPFESANVLRRLELSGRLTEETAAQAHDDLLDLPVQLWPHAAVATAAWRLRGSLTIYDASYVALAVTLAVPLVTLDRRLARTASTSCEVVVPGSG